MTLHPTRPTAPVPTRTRRRSPVGVAAVVAAVLGTTLGAVALLPGPAGALRPVRATATTALAGSAPAGGTAATTCAGFAADQTLLEQQLSNRTTTLGTLTGKVSASTTLSAADRSTLESDLADETTGIAALTAKVPGDTTCAELATDSRAMILSYRVYAVMTPQTDLVILADRINSLSATLAGDEPSLQAAIAAAGAQGKNVATAQAADADFNTRVAGAATAVAGLSSTLLAQNPAGFPASYSVFKNAYTSEATGRADLQAADTDLHVIAQTVG